MSRTKMKYNWLIVKLGIILVLATVAIPVIYTAPAMAYGQYIDIHPNHGPVGTEISVYGSLFTPSVLTDNLTPDITTSAKTYFHDKTTLVKTTIIDAWGHFETSFLVNEYPTGNHTVWVCDESASPPVWVSATFRVEPQIQLSRSSGYVGDNITASGTGFAATSTVTIYFDDSRVATATTDQNGSFANTAIIIPESDNSSHNVKAGDASSSNSTCEFITRQQVTVNPTSGPIGGEVTISGSGFAATSNITVTFGDDVVATTPGLVKTGGTGNFTGKFLIPTVTTNTYAVEASDGSNKADTTFLVVLGGRMDRITGHIASSVTFSGAGFTPNRIVTIYYDTTPVAEATTDANGDFSVSFRVPVSSSGNHTVSATDGTNTTESTFTVVLVAGVKLNRIIGYVGCNVTLSGTRFIPDTIVTICYDTTPVAEATVDAKGNFSVSFKVPAGLEGEHTVSATDGTNTVECTFTVLVPVGNLSRFIGHVGSDVTFSGRGFTPEGVVTICYDTTPVAEATVDVNGSFSASFKVPASHGGEHIISTTDGVNTANATFTMESIVPPTPVPLLPVNTSKAKPETHFVWESVADPSGVTYTLQIASDASFTSLVLEKGKLTAAEYTLTPEEKLESTRKGVPYYWRVRAVDNASNISGWSTVQEFYIVISWSSMSPWLLYSVIAEGGIFTGLFGFWLVRKRR